MNGLSLLRLLRPTLTRGLALSCLAFVGGVLLLGWGIARALPPPNNPAIVHWRWGLALVASFCFTASAMSLASALQRVLWPGRRVPTQGLGRRVPRRGRVVPEGEPLLAPLSGQPCVAYFYRLYRWRDGADHAFELMYGGAAGMAFRLDSSGATVPVRTLPRVLDEPVVLEGPEVLARARQLVATTPFTPREGLAGGLATVAELVSNATQRVVQPGRPYRRDWIDPRVASVDLATLHFDEVTLPVGAQACVVGNWSDEAQAIMPSTTVTEPALAAVGEAGIAAMQRELGDMRIDGAELREGGPADAFVAAAITGAFGAGALVLAHWI